MNTNSPWAEKYRPRKLSEIAGQASAMQELLSWFKNFKRDKHRAAILHGPEGTGKTSLVQALANETNYELIQMNASDFRTEKLVSEKIGNASRQRSLIQKSGKIILVDEVDGLHGNSDRGGVSALQKIIQNTEFPIIMTANDFWKPNLKSLRFSCKAIQMKKVDVRTISSQLKQIAEKEGVKVKEAIINEIARRAEGDLRAAINDLQTFSQVKGAGEDDLDVLSGRDKEIPIYSTLTAIFKSKNFKMIQDTLYNSGKDSNEIMLWVVENIATEYEKPEEIAKAYDAVSRADVFRGRIIHTQNWSLQSYSNELMSYGVASAKKEKYSKFVKYAPPFILQKMSATMGSRAMRKSVAESLGGKLHCSRKRAVEQFPYFSIILKEKELELPLEEEQKEFLKKYS